MKRKIFSILMVLCMVIGLFNTNFASEPQKAEASDAITQSDFIKAKGKYLYNNYGNGDAVLLRGTNAGGYLVQEFWMCPTEYSSGVSDQMDIINTLTSRFGADAAAELIKVYEDNYWTEADFDNCAAMGINCIRLPLWYRNLVDANGNMLSNAFDRIDWFVDQAGQRGIYVIIDMHGAPGSQNGSDHSGIDGGDSKLSASEFFFGSNASANQQLYYDLWEKIAVHYVGNPVVAGYDLLNEPYCTYRYNSGYSDDYLHSMLWSVYDKAYDLIRAIDPDHVIIMEATWNPVDLPDPSTYGWENVMYEYHNYLYDDYDNANGGQISNMKSKLDAITSANYNVPSYMGEFCYMNNTSAWQEGLQLLNDYGINWTTWTYKVVSSYGNWGLYNQSVESVNVTTDSYSEIYRKWSNVGSSYANSSLVNAVKSYFTSSVNLPESGTVYEAENYTIVGGAKEAQSFYSGGYAAGSMNSGVALADVADDWSNIKSVQFTNINADYTGTHTLRIAYNGDDDKTILVRVNGGENIQVSLPRLGDGSWNVMHTAEIKINLNSGSNTIWVSGTINDINTWANIDYIEIISDGYDRVTSENGTIYEAEDNNIINGEKEFQEFYSGGYAAGGMNSSVAYADVASDWSNIKYVNFSHVSADKAGIYDVTIAYNGDDDKTILMKVNGGENIQVSLPKQGDGTWNVMHKKTVQVELNEGLNTIWVSGTINDITTWANIDYIEVVYNSAIIEEPVTADVMYMSNGSQYSSKTVPLGSTIEASLPETPERDGYIFLGWFTENVGTVSSVDASILSKAANLDTVVNSDTVLYAGWLDIGTVSRDSKDTMSPEASNLSGFYLVGAQYREADSIHTAGIRFVARISDSIINNVEALNSANSGLKPESESDKGVGYGFVLTLAKNLSSTNMLVKDVNAVNVSGGMAVCPAVNTYMKYNGYKLYTAVVTGIPESSYASDIAARMYITYYDANGQLQTCYYTESDSSCSVGGAYFTNFNAVYNASK